MLEIKGLSKRYGEKVALQDVSFQVNQGEIVALLGANGSGKTTTINSICNLIDVDEGEIYFEGQSIQKDRQYLSKIGAVLGGSRNINWRLTASQNARYFAALKGYPAKHLKLKIAEIEKQLGLDKYADLEILKLSTGNKQKASLLCALAYSPKLLLLDEPTLGLDFGTVNELQDIIKQQSHSTGQGYLITSHDMSFIDKICQKVIVIDNGKLIFNGSIEALKSELFTYRLCFNAPNLSDEQAKQAVAKHCLGDYHYEQEERVVNIQFEQPKQVLGLLAWLHSSAFDLTHLSMAKLSMEDAYQSLTARKQTE